MANVKLYHVTNPLLNVNFSLHLPRNRNLSVVTAATLRAGVSFFVQAPRKGVVKKSNSRMTANWTTPPRQLYAERKLLLATYLIDVSQTVKKKTETEKNLQLQFTGNFCSQHTWSMYRRLWAVCYFSLQGYCTRNRSAGLDTWWIVRKKEDCKQSRCIRLGVLILHEV